MHIKLSGLEKRFGDVEVLRDLNFDDEVSTLAIIGPSGGGKSTLLRIIGGLLEPSAGTVEIDGVRVDFAPEALPTFRSRLGFVFQQSGLFHHLTARENIALPLKAVHKQNAQMANDRADELLARLGLSQQADAYPLQLSGGQQQRVAIARAVAARPQLLLLDEPTSALDPEYTGEVLDVINSLKETGTRFVIVTHEMGFARHACDRVAFLHQGTLREYGEAEQLFAHPQTPELQTFLSKLLAWNV